MADAGPSCFSEELACKFSFLVGARDRECFLGGLLEMRRNSLHAERRRDSADLGELVGDRVGSHGSYGAASIADAAARFHAPMVTEGCDIYVDGSAASPREVRETSRNVAD